MPNNYPDLFTLEEMREKLLVKFSGLLDYWLDESRVETVEQKMEGMLHSVFATLDGAASDLPGFLVIPNVTTQDAAYHVKNREKHAPPVADSVAGAMDPSGVLHELWHKVRAANKLPPRFNGMVPLRATDGKQDLSPIVKSQPNEIDEPWNGQ